jgi:DNA repair protein RadC
VTTSEAAYQVVAPVLQDLAQAVILAHNHPSGVSAPSREDLELTRQLVAAGRVLALPVLDHLVIRAGEYTSLLQERPNIFSASSAGSLG